MDFEDLLVNGYQLLKSDVMVRQKYREIIRHLLVDEFQDTNPIQMEILTLLLPSVNGNDSSFGFAVMMRNRYTDLWGHLLATFSTSNRCSRNRKQKLNSLRHMIFLWLSS
jgi:superfamily I DNA/RNA helicase